MILVKLLFFKKTAMASPLNNLPFPLGFSSKQPLQCEGSLQTISERREFSSKPKIGLFISLSMLSTSTNFGLKPP